MLNDNINHKLHLFKIPANSNLVDDVKTRLKDGNTMIDFELVN